MNNLCFLVNILESPITYVVEMFLKKRSNFWTTIHFFTLNSVSLNLITQLLLWNLLFAVRITTILRFYNRYDVKTLFNVWFYRIIHYSKDRKYRLKYYNCALVNKIFYFWFGFERFARVRALRIFDFRPPSAVAVGLISKEENALRPHSRVFESFRSSGPENR